MGIFSDLQGRAFFNAVGGTSIGIVILILIIIFVHFARKREMYLEEQRVSLITLENNLIKSL